MKRLSMSVHQLIWNVLKAGCWRREDKVVSTTWTLCKRIWMSQTKWERDVTDVDVKIQYTIWCLPESTMFFCTSFAVLVCCAIAISVELFCREYVEDMSVLKACAGCTVVTQYLCSWSVKGIPLPLVFCVFVSLFVVTMAFVSLAIVFGSSCCLLIDLLSLYNIGHSVSFMAVKGTNDINYLDRVIYYKKYSKQVRG